MARPRSALLALALMLTAFGAARAQAGCPLTAADVQAINFSKAAQACRVRWGHVQGPPASSR